MEIIIVGTHNDWDAFGPFDDGEGQAWLDRVRPDQPAETIHLHAPDGSPPSECCPRLSEQGLMRAQR